MPSLGEDIKHLRLALSNDIRSIMSSKVYSANLGFSILENTIVSVQHSNLRVCLRAEKNNPPVHSLKRNRQTKLVTDDPAEILVLASCRFLFAEPERIDYSMDKRETTSLRQSCSLSENLPAESTGRYVSIYFSKPGIFESKVAE